VYDLLPVLIPEVFPSGLDSLHSRWLSILSQYTGALCISKAVADELSIWINRHQPECLKSFQVDWFHLGSDIENSIPSLGLPSNAQHILDGLNSGATFLMVGTIEPRKGYGQILDAFSLFWEQNSEKVNLVIVGKPGWMVDSLMAKIQKHPEKGVRLFWLDKVSDEFLEKIYDSSDCLIAASLGEGFGLPIIEAARHNLHIIARDIPVFREVAPSNAVFFSGLNLQNVVIAIQQILDLKNLGVSPEKIETLSWGGSVIQIYSALGLQIAPK
jgi:glycosyltransferase involved in cell wall biosynthesis